MYSRVYVEITNICNMHCSFCHGHSRKPRRMSREEFSQILDQLSGVTSYIYYHLMGEPLMHPELPEFLRMSTERGFRSVITTNGTLLHAKGNEILSAGVHKVSISIHSFETGGEDAHRAYLRQIADFAEAATNAGTLISLRLWNQGCDGGMNDRTLQILQELFPGEWSPNTRGFRIREKLYLEWGQRFTWPDKDAPVQGAQVTCYGMRDHFGILCDGTVVPCCLDSDGIVNLGNIFTQSVDQIMSAPRAVAMVEGFRCRKATEDLCRRCAYAQRFI